MYDLVATINDQRRPLQKHAMMTVTTYPENPVNSMEVHPAAYPTDMKPTACRVNKSEVKRRTASQEVKSQTLTIGAEQVFRHRLDFHLIFNTVFRTSIHKDFLRLSSGHARQAPSSESLPVSYAASHSKQIQQHVVFLIRQRKKGNVFFWKLRINAK